MRDGRKVRITGKVPRAYTVTRTGVRPKAIEYTESQLDRMMKYFAPKGMSREEAVERIAQSIDDAVLDKPVAINVPEDIVDEILGDGRLKNQYETGTSKGMFNPRHRMDAETTTFDIDRPTATTLGTPVQEFPIYGYVYTGTGNVGRYGDVRMELKDRVKSRTTMTVGDSLEHMSVGRSAPAPIARASKEPGSWDGAIHLLDLAEGNWDRISCFETQIHGGVTLDDISRIVLPRGAGPWIKDRANKLGIEVVYE